MTEVADDGRVSGTEYVQTYRKLTQAANDAGLMERRRGFYWSMMAVMVITTGLLAAGMWLLGDSWFQLILAALLGVVMAQIGFLGHEAAHQQIFSSTRWNQWASRVLGGLFAGLSHRWWINKHNRHHMNPNKIGHDPDVGSRVLAFTPQASNDRSGLGARLARRQGYFFMPLLFFEGFQLHVASVKTLISRRRVPYRWVEIIFVGVRLAAYVSFVFWVMSPALATAFVIVQVGVFGFFLGGAFAPNHIGMPTVPAHVQIDFLRRQVLMSRNIRGGWWVHFLMGGLEYQIEHHLFPRAPRPQLRRLQPLVRDFCASHDVTYTETSMGQAFATVLSYLNQVGIKNRDPFSCPLVRELRG